MRNLKKKKFVTNLADIWPPCSTLDIQVMVICGRWPLASGTLRLTIGQR